MRVIAHLADFAADAAAQAASLFARLWRDWSFFVPGVGGGA